MRYLVFALLIVVCSVTYNPCYSHPGRTAADGCHTDHSTGLRHCHNGGAGAGVQQIAQNLDPLLLGFGLGCSRVQDPSDATNEFEDALTQCAVDFGINTDELVIGSSQGTSSSASFFGEYNADEDVTTFDDTLKLRLDEIHGGRIIYVNVDMTIKGSHRFVLGYGDVLIVRITNDLDLEVGNISLYEGEIFRNLSEPLVEFVEIDIPDEDVVEN